MAYRLSRAVLAIDDAKVRERLIYPVRAVAGEP
jgi:hypothetical protein